MRMLKMVGLTFVLLLVVPVLITQLGEEQARTFEAVSLEETEYQELAFENPEQDLRLAGMLFVPEGAGPYPAVVMIHGSGPSRRTNGWYLTVARYLQSVGVMVLLPDKRGSEKSEGQWQTASYQDLATDTAAAVDFVRNLGPGRVSRVGLIGFSQGGRILPIVASGRSEPDFVVSIVGGVLPAHQSLVYEETHNLRQFGVLPGIAHVLAYPAAWSLIYLRQREHWAAVGDFDPLPYWARVSAPALVLFGSEDTNVNTPESVARLQSLGKDNLKVIVYPGSGHALQDPPGQGNRLFRREALEAIGAFILLH